MKLSLGLTPRDYSVAGGVVYDTDAQAYFTANTAITSSADKNAINTFYLGLKSDGIYTKIKAMYLPIWGSAASSKWNLINNRTFDLSFSTGWTFSSGGALPNGTSAYADTFLIPSSNFANTNVHFGFYSRTSSNLGGTDMAAYWTDAPAGSSITAVQVLTAGRASDNNAIGYMSNDDAYKIQYSQTNASGMFVVSRTATNSLKMYQSGTLKQTNTTINTSKFNSLPQNKVFISAMNYRDSTSSSIIQYGAKQFSFSSIGDGLTDAEATNFYNRVQTLMTYFGINV